MIRPVSDAAEHPTPEDWRILRALSFYRLLLVTLQLLLYETGYLGLIFEELRPRWFYGTCIAYAITALLLMQLVVYRRPRVSIQAHLHFAIDVFAITSLAYACGGIASGLGMLVLTPAVGCALVVSPRMAWVLAAGATLVVFGEEILRQYPEEFDTAPFTQAGILGLMFFATSLAANTVAARARRSEALAAQVGLDLANLAQVNERVIEHMQTGVLVVEAGGRIRLLNAAAAELLDARPGGSLAREAPGLAAELDAWRAGHPSGGAPLAPKPGGNEVIPRFTRLGSGEGAPVLVLLDSARLLREEAQQLKLAALGRLSASIAHEIRNPLSAISHAGQLLAESAGTSAENRRLLSMIERHSGRIDRIVREVMSMSRRENLSPVVFGLHDWLESAIAQYREAHPGKSRNVVIHRVPAHLQVRFDPSHLQQVLYNLWDNSFEHGGRDGRRVTVELRSERIDRGPAHLDIADNGPGIPAELLDHVFEPFFTTAHGGTGLGLFLARELCEYNHARLMYRPLPDGACFRLVFYEAAQQAA